MTSANHQTLSGQSSSGLNVNKFLAVIALVFVALSLAIIARTSPATGHEITIYDAYPSHLWLFMIASITCGIGILMHQAFTREESRWWLAGLAIVILTNSIFLLLPVFRGYAFYGFGDAATHLGWMRDIINTGHITPNDLYPIEHILGASLVQMTGISLESIIPLFSVLFSGMYIAFMYLLARSVASNQGQVLLVIVLATPLIYTANHAAIQPSLFSLFMVPCLFYLYLRRERSLSGRLANTILILLLALLITYFHPVTALYVIVTFLGFWLAYILYSRFLRQQPGQYVFIGRNSLGMAGIMCITFFMWYFNYAFILNRFRRVYEWLVYQLGTAPIEEHIGLLGEANLSLVQTIGLFINSYGAIFLMLSISAISFAYVLWRSLRRDHKLGTVEFAFAIQFLIASLIGALEYLGVGGEGGPSRVVRFSLLMGTVLSGLVVYDFISTHLGHSNRKTILSARSLGAMTAIGLLTVAMVVLSLGSVYYSPRTYAPNTQVTHGAIAGTKWLAESREPGIMVVVPSLSGLWRLQDYLYGTETGTEAKAKVSYKKVPAHFGYDEYDSIAQTLASQHQDKQDKYMAIFKWQKLWPLSFPENMRPMIPHCNEEDFEKLESDPTAAKIYFNGEFEVWRVFAEND